MIFGKKSTNTTSAPTPEPIIEPTAPVGKGRPTPKRAQSQAKNVRPLVPGDRRAAAKAAREQERSLRNRAYQGMQRGEERYLPARDKGPQKRFIRDYVDARWNLGEFFLPVAMLFIVAQFFVMQYPALAFTVIIALYAIVLIAVIDAAILWLRLRKALIAKFGEVQKGSVMYTIMRAFQLRMSRLPKPIHKKHGHYPN
ncbi:MAG: DUF3043 domain-containing protein [Cellulomonadaceae bacterium]|nr:DUF3043 domain-containing protein [Cellulomonadaceae bacterium]